MIPHAKDIRMISIVRSVACVAILLLLASCVIPVPVPREWFTYLNPWAEDPRVSVLCQLTELEPSDCTDKSVTELLKLTGYVYLAGLDNRSIQNPGSLLNVSAGYGARAVGSDHECFSPPDYVVDEPKLDETRFDREYKIEFNPIEFLRFSGVRDVGTEYFKVGKITGTINRLEERSVNLNEVIDQLSSEYSSFNRSCRKFFESRGNYLVRVALVAPAIEFVFLDYEDRQICISNENASNYFEKYEVAERSAWG
jgi:hypothetical protein